MVYILSIYAFIIGSASSVLGLHSDTAAVITEAIRINAGQLNFLDYSIHFPFITAKLLTYSNNIFDMTTAFIIYSGLLNALYALVMFNIAFKFNTKYSLCIGFISASWFIPTIGGYYYDNLAIAIGFFQFYLVLSNTKGENFKNIVIGLLCVFGVMVKQSTSLAMIIPTCIFFIASQYNKNLLRQTSFISVGVIIGIILVFSYLENLDTGYLKKYLNGIFEASEIYAKNSGRLTIQNLLNTILYPYGVSIFSLKNMSLGVLLFSPIVIIQYLFYFSWPFLQEKVNLNLFYFVLIGSLLTEFIVGRGSMNLTYFLGLQILCLLSIKKRS